MSVSRELNRSLHRIASGWRIRWNCYVPCYEVYNRELNIREWHTRDNALMSYLKYSEPVRIGSAYRPDTGYRQSYAPGKGYGPDTGYF